MRYTVTKQRIELLGGIWQPFGMLAGLYRDLTAFDLAQIGDVTDRDAVERWILLHASGDFSSLVDFRADFDIDGRHIEHDWKLPESEGHFSDCFAEPE